MKNWLTFIYILFLCPVLVAQEGVRFQKLTLDEALAKAKKENKFVFMDYHTSGCSACVVMNEEVFPRADMGKYFNDRFICVSYNTDRPENKYIRKLYKTGYVPAFFILHSDGSIYHKFLDFAPSHEFIAHVKKALKEKNSYSYLEQRYHSGNATYEDTIAFANALYNFNEFDLLKQLMDELAPHLTLQDSLHRNFYPLISNFNKKSNREFFYRHVDALKKTLGKQKVENILERELKSEINYCLPNIFNPNTIPDFTDIRKKIANSTLKARTFLLMEIDMLDALYAKNYTQTFEYLQKFIKIRKATPYLLSIVADHMLENGNQQELEKILSLKKALLRLGEQSYYSKGIRLKFEKIEEKLKTI